MKKLMKNGLSLHNALPTFNPLPISAFGLRQGQRKVKLRPWVGKGRSGGNITKPGASRASQITKKPGSFPG
jgi:hypothetical protein